MDNNEEKLFASLQTVTRVKIDWTTWVLRKPREMCHRCTYKTAFLSIVIYEEHKVTDHSFSVIVLYIVAFNPIVCGDPKLASSKLNYINVFGWAHYHCHANIAGYKPVFVYGFH